MNCNSPFFRYVADNGLEYIQPFMTGAKDGVLVLTGSESVYTCLEKLEGYKPVAKYVVINNEKNRNHMVLLNNTRNLLGLEYDQYGYVDTGTPILVNKGKGINHRMFAGRYILFLQLPEHTFSIGEYAFQHYIRTAGIPSSPLHKAAGDSRMTTRGEATKRHQLKEICRQASDQLLLDAGMEAQVILHCSFNSPGERIWLTANTFLIDNATRKKSNLVYAQSIKNFPNWTYANSGITTRFTMVFTALPKGCRTFDVSGEVRSIGSFYLSGIQRTKTDVYDLEIK
jgi:hypothetical protein